MDTLPTELHALIVQNACFDHGTAVRALNRVSKYFHEVSRPYLYHSVSASGTEQVIALAERLERTPQGLRQIQHLFLSDARSARRLTERETHALARIIVISAPTLFTLALAMHAPGATALIARLFRTFFPHLRSLAVSGLYPFPSTPGRFPALRFLRLDGHRSPHGLLQLGALADACPALCELEVTGLGAAGAFVLELEEALAGFDELGAGAYGEDAEGASASLPPGLERITLQAAPEPAGAANTTDAVKDRVLLSRLEALRSREAKEGERVSVVVLERSTNAVSADDVRRQWLAGLLEH